MSPRGCAIPNSSSKAWASSRSSFSFRYARSVTSPPPQAGEGECSSLDHFVGGEQYPKRHVDSERCRRLTVDDEEVPDRLLDRQVTRLGALEDTIHVVCSSDELVVRDRSVGHQPTISGEVI